MTRPAYWLPARDIAVGMVVEVAGSHVRLDDIEHLPDGRVRVSGHTDGAGEHGRAQYVFLAGETVTVGD
jgi:hypothetical protein